MKKIILLALMLVVAQASFAQKEVKLFNGKDLSGWKIYGTEKWYVQDGLLVSEELGFIFMQHLAKEISYKTNSSIITDNQKFNNYANFERIEIPSLKKKVKLAENITA